MIEYPMPNTRVRSRPEPRPAPAPREVASRLRLQQRCGLLLCAAGALLALWRGWQLLPPAEAVTTALALGAAAALATALGVLPVLLARAPAARTQDTLLGFGGGVMLAAACFSLLVPALHAAAQAGLGPWPRALGVGAALLAGALLLMLLDHVLPHAHGIGPGGGDLERRRRVTLFVLAIVLHNVPEGLAIGVAAAGGDSAGALALATGIAIQDVPEGLVVALALQAAGVGRYAAAGIGAASGLVEPLAAVAAAAALASSAALLPWGLAFAAGAMIFVVGHELIPESQRRGHSRRASVGLMLGFVLMMVLDSALG
ncbi:ZIP family metal transporter [Rubrivivax gelatinosus]|nr:ZIP family metal transporter [Rubrivivax gelatinosus]